MLRSFRSRTQAAAWHLKNRDIFLSAATGPLQRGSPMFPAPVWDCILPVTLRKLTVDGLKSPVHRVKGHALGACFRVSLPLLNAASGEVLSPTVHRDAQIN